MDRKVETIVIEPSKLGNETEKWIAIGNFLHKSSVVSGLGCLLTGICWPDRGFLYFPLGFLSTICAGVYTVSWQFDPCCKYQVERDTLRLQRLPLHSLTTSIPVVLVRRSDFSRKILHSAISVTSLTFCAWRWYLYHWQI